MNIHKKILIHMFAFVSGLLITLPLFAQENRKGLIVSEAYLDKGQPGSSWVEVYNPTDQPLVLERFRLSHVKTIDVLPADIRRQGGIEIEPDGHLVLCADGDQFDSVWGTKIGPVVVEVLADLPEGGFIALATKGLGLDGEDGFRFGNPASSLHVEASFGDLVLSFSKNKKNKRSYSRRIEKTEAGSTVYGFSESAPTPGR